MKYMSILSLFIVLLMTEGYAKQEVKKNTSLTHQQQVYTYLKKELIAGQGYGDEGFAMKMYADYLSVVAEELKKHLKEANFQFLSKKAFKEKVKHIFDIEEKRFSYDGSTKYINTVLIVSPGSGENLEFLADKQFIMFPYRMPQIIDYKKVYPKLAQLELQEEENYIRSKERRQRVFWKDMINSTDIKDNITFTVKFNQYILNDDESQLPWLLKNHYRDMYDMVAKYGYTQDKYLLKILLINATYRIKSSHRGDLYGSVVNGGEGYVIFEETFDIIAQELGDKKFHSVNENAYLKDLNEFIVSTRKYEMFRFKSEQYTKDMEQAVYYIATFINKYLIEKQFIPVMPTVQ